MRTLRYILTFVIWTVLMGIGGERLCAQVLELSSSDDFKKCPGLEDYRFRFENKSEKGTFASFSINWRQGSTVGDLTNVSYDEINTYHDYPTGVYTLTFTGFLPNGGTRQNTYQIINEPQPAIGINIAQKGTKCVGSVVDFVIDGYTVNSEHTTYQIEFGDGDTKSYTNAEMSDLRGKINHRYERSSCQAGQSSGFTITVTANNLCLNPIKATLENTYIVMMPDVDFTFGDLACTDKPVPISNSTKPDADTPCNAVNYKWSWKRKGSADKPVDFEPPVIFREPGVYEIKLVGSRGTECSVDSLKKDLTVIRSVKALWTVTPADAVCEGRTVTFDASASVGDRKVYQWSVLGSNSGYCNVLDPAGESTGIVFTRFGDYRIRLYLRNGCSEDWRDTTIHVKKDPIITKFTALNALCPNDILVLDAAKVGYEWYNNPDRPTWSVEGAADGWVWVGGDGTHKLNPQIQFTKPGEYTLRVKVDGVGCDATPDQLQKSQTIKIYDPRITADITLVGGQTEYCENEEVTFVNNSTGEQVLKYQWTVTKNGTEALLNTDYVYVGTTSTDAVPRLKFLTYGSYRIETMIRVECNSAMKSFDVLVKKDPEVVRLDALTAMCPEVTGRTGILNLSGKVAYNWYNNTGHDLVWEVILPSGVTDGYAFVNGTTDKSEFPQIQFTKAGTYTLRVKVTSAGCGGSLLEKSQTIEIYDPQIQKAVSLKDGVSVICEKEKVAFVNTTTAVHPSYKWTVTRSEGGMATDYTFVRPDTDAAPEIQFNRYGTYKVRIDIFAACANDYQEFEVTVKKDPEVVGFDPLEAICAQRVLNLYGRIRYEWYNAGTRELTWEVTGDATGYEFINSTTPQSEFPQIKFTKYGNYTLKVKLAGVACRGEKLEASRSIEIYNPDVVKDITIKGGGKDICEKTDVVFENRSQGVNLSYDWSVTSENDVYPDKGYSFASGTDSKSPAPTIRFERYGTYTVTADLHSTCNPDKETFVITVRRDPEVVLRDLVAICPADGLVLDSSKVIYTWNDNTPAVLWVVSPPAGVTFAKEAVYPDMAFTHPGSYRIEVTLMNTVGCKGNALSATKLLRVYDPAMELKVNPDKTTVCAGNKVHFNNESTAAETPAYVWTVAPAGGWRFEGSTATDKSPDIVFTDYGIYTVKLEMRGSCDTLSKEMSVAVRRDPAVTLRDFPAMCPGELTIAAEGDYDWRENAQRVDWKITPDVGAVTGLYPKVNFRQEGQYRIIAELQTNGCPADHLKDTTYLTVFKPDIDIRIEVKREVAEGETVKVENKTVGQGLSYLWTLEEGQTDGFSFVLPSVATDKEPQFLFTKYGKYKFRLDVKGTCTDSVKFYEVTVRGIPSYTFNPIPNMCAGSTLKLSDYLTYDGRGATIVPHWTITPDDGGYVYVNGGGAGDLMPEVRFIRNAAYELKLEAEAEYGGVQTLSRKVNVLSTEVKAVTREDMSGCTDLEVVLTNESVGDSLTYNWAIMPAEGWHYKDVPADHAGAREPSIVITGRNNYQVKLEVSNICSADQAEFNIRAYSKPEIDPIADIRNVCERGYVFDGGEVVRVEENGDALNYIRWTVTPEGYRFAAAGEENGLTPQVTFEGKETPYQLRLEVRNGCSETITEEFTILVDAFEDIIPLRDTALCALTPRMLLKAIPENGCWTTSEEGMIDSVGINEWYFNPRKDEDAVWEVVYSRGHKSCMAKDTMEVTVHQLPVVNAGADTGMCVNWPPMVLPDRTPSGGAWLGHGVTAGVFTPENPGDTKLEYWYTDPVTRCPNRDSIVLTVYGLPDPSFGTNVQHCLNADSLFVPDELNAGNRFSWDFGDGNTDVFSDGAIGHRYTAAGFYEVVLTATSVHRCVWHSAPKRIEVYSLPPKAEFTTDTVEGCGPLDVVIAVDSLKYEDPYGHFSYSWLFGNGGIGSDLQPVPDVQTYHPNVYDTTYRILFKVYNVCGSESVYRDITVFSSPEASFLMSPDEGCDPLKVSFINRSTGNGNKYSWTLGDGQVTMEKNPVHTFHTGAKATQYEVILVSTNDCNTSEFRDTLTVKPNSLNAVFKLDRRYLCVGDTVCFTNYSSDTLSTIINQYWSFGDGEYSQAWHVCHAYATPGKREVALVIDNGCAQAEFRDSLTVYPIPKLRISGDKQLCEDDIAHLEVVSDQPLKQVKWVFGDGESAANVKVEHVYKEAGVYTARVNVLSNAIPGCPAEGEWVVEAWPKPDLKILPLDTVACSPLLYQPVVVGEGFLKWDYGVGEGISSEDQYEYVNDTNFILNYRTTAYAETGHGCKEEYTGHIRVHNSPRAIMDKRVSFGRPEKVLFINLSRDYTACTWYLPDGKVVHSPENQEVSFETQGHYPISLVARNEYGCVDSVAFEHISFMSGLYFPNTFIPHSKNEQVNRFTGVGMGLKEYHLEIYDLYGNKVWETKELEDGRPSGGWDGTNKNGELLPQGVYTWRAKAVFFSEDLWTGKNNMSGAPETTQGSVLLLRK